jgi:hypothetical protein
VSTTNDGSRDVALLRDVAGKIHACLPRVSGDRRRRITEVRGAFEIMTRSAERE